ncbi:Transcriptional activator spt7 [Coemansia guatemalensis]|uniref:Transcriptional activator spt7 n=1 Tax=Coemansia guatemalensis TaxID=2761395 RepID=A0A9W8I5I2_9FUNG|nr:Transcriptional activator spt7 [Coemansia guatemalensis]
MASEESFGVGSGACAEWAKRSYRIALRIHERGEWASYLTEGERIWLTRALESQELWSQFISPSSEQWRLRALPSPEFENAMATASRSGQSNGTSGSPSESSRQASEAANEIALGRRSASKDANVDTNNKSNNRRIHTTTTITPLTSDDDMLSALSDSDIDMGIWSGGVSHAVSPEPPAAESATTREPSSNTGSRDLAIAEWSLVCATAAFHARSAIFEHYAAALCGADGCTMCADVATAQADIKHAEELASVNGRDTKTNGIAIDDSMAQVPSLSASDSQAPLQSRQIDEDEDYDDFDSSEDKGTQNGDADVQIKEEPKKEDVQQDDEQAKNSEQRILLRETFHTLDELDDIAHDYTMHSSHVQQIREVAEQRAAEPKDMLEHKIGALTNMKNLAQFIDRHRDSVSLSTRELSSLLSEVRPKRSKWANERRVGQAELYEALEQVLQELRSMGDVALPFLSQVKRKDAPDYYKVIRQPMDLGTMARNLRNETYNSKRQFADHLQLVHDNCYTYNTEPGNYYRRSADALMAKANQLMEAVPDIVVRDRASIVDDAHTEYGDESGNESQSMRAGFGPREGSAAIEDGTPAPGSVDPGLSLPRALTDDQSFSAAAAPDASADLSPLVQNILRAMSTDGLTRSAVAVLADGCEKGPAELLWRSRVRQHVSDYMEQLNEGEDSAFGERRVQVRTPEKMRAFLRAAHEAATPTDGEALVAIARLANTSDLRTVYAQGASTGSDIAEVRRRNEELDNARAEWLDTAERLDSARWTFVGECELGGGISLPERLDTQARKHGVLRWLNDDCEEPIAEFDGDLPPLPPLEAYAAVRFPDNAMWRLMAENVDYLKSIREIDYKIWATKLNVPVGFLQPGSSAEPSVSSGPRKEDEADRPSVRDMHADYAHKPDPPVPFNMNAASARQLLQRTSAFMLAHTGFDAISNTALACLSDFLIDYMTNLGRTLRTYCDKHGHSMSAEAIVAHSLYANGTEDLAELEYYIRGEVGRYSGKLGDLHKKLTRSYQDIMSDGRPGAASADAAALENGNAYVTGMVGGLGDLGDDFLGFKELGLDKEYGVDYLSVPQRLWVGSSNAPTEDNLLGSQEEELSYSLPKSWAPIVGPQGQIGLMRRFIAEKLKEVNGVAPPGYQDESGDEAEKEPMSSEGKQQDKMPEHWKPIPEDDELSPKARYGASRPKAPPPNYLTHPRTHMHVGSGKASAQSERAGKKRPAKSTGGSKTTRKKIAAS